MTTATATKPATKVQVAFVKKLALAVTPKKLPTAAQIANWDEDKARQIIGWYLDKPEGKAVIPDGKYAVKTIEFNEDAVNQINFYQVRTETKESSKWFGFTFVDHIVSETTYPVKGKAKANVLAAIGADKEAAASLYGMEEQKCGICGRNLTNDTSRKRGIGPKCAGDMGW